MGREIAIVTRDSYFIIHSFENELNNTLGLEVNKVYSEIFLGETEFNLQE